MGFAATESVAGEAKPTGDATETSLAKFLGRWKVAFESSSDPAVAVFERADAGVQGTFLTTTGDYRYLAGRVVDDRLVLSTFDGAHAFLFDAHVNDDGTLHGNFWSGTSWHEAWQAQRDDSAGLPDGFDEVALRGEPEWSKVAVTDLDGKRRLLSTADFEASLTLVSIFGSWCPNCHDEAPLLADLRRRFGPHGLNVIGLAFEAAGEFEPDARQVRRFVTRYGLDFPVYLAGVSDKDRASEVLPFLARVKAFPTTLFVARSGKILAVYSGFSGPATGQAHGDLKKRFESIIRRELELDDSRPEN